MMDTVNNHNFPLPPTADAQCKSDVGVHIPGTYTTAIDNFAFDIEAKLDRQLKVVKNQIDDAAADPTTPRTGKGPPVYVGLDAEWVFDAENDQNNILSVQFYLIGEDGEYPHIFYPKSYSKTDRPSFVKSLSKLILEAKKVGVVLEWPSRIIVCGFFLRADLAVFSDLVRFKSQIDNVGGRIATIGDDAVLEVELDDDDLANVTKKHSSVVSDDGIPRIMAIRFMDMGRHAPEGTQLTELGNMLDLPKLSIPEGYSIERMDLLLKGNKPAFEAYGLRDAEIPVRYMLKLQEFARKEADVDMLPTTGSGLGVKMFINTLKASGAEFNHAFGVCEKTETYWYRGSTRSKAGVRTSTELVATDMRAIHEPFISNCYHGGRNECFAFGPTADAVWHDFDLAGAYTTGMVDMLHIDYDRAWVTKNPKDFKGHVMGFALVNFSHPDGVRFPVLPVSLGALGLVFPMRGTSYCTAPEIEVALSLGCEIEILHGVIYPWRDGDDRIFEPFTRQIRELRAAHPKGSLSEKYAKFLGNSCYGKTAQGLKPKRVFDTRTMKSEQLPPSQITNAPMAAHITGFVRATLAEQLNAIPTHLKIISITTDGFLTDACMDELDLTGSMSRRYQALCERVAPESAMLECKHRVRQLIPFKTRGQLTAEQYGDEPVVLAKAGVSPPVPKAEHNAFMVNLFLSRKPGDKTHAQPFTSLRAQWEKGMDVVRLPRSAALNMEFDMKCRPINPTMRSVAGVEHLAFDTVPWEYSHMGERARAFFDGWRRKNCLKTLDDWQRWQEHFQFSTSREKQQRKGSKVTGINATAEGSVGLARRLFLRAYAQGAWGVSRTMTYAELADWLTLQGYPTKNDEVKNAKRASLVVGVVPATAAVTILLNILVRQFPTLDVGKFLAQDQGQFAA
jgi:hypothetical protein